MKYSLPFKKNKAETANEDVVELQIEYDKDIESLKTFCENHKDKTITMHIFDPDNQLNDFFDERYLEDINEINEDYDLKFCIAVDLSEGVDEKIMTIIQLFDKNGLKYFSPYAVDSFGKLCHLLNFGVSDIFICNNLMFNLKKVNQLKEHYNKSNVNIRAYPNFIQREFFGLIDICQAFIRPEDVEVYDPYIQIMNFLEDQKAAGADAYWFYNIYRRGKWDGEIKELFVNFIPNRFEHADKAILLDGKLNNALPPKQFAQNRVSCGQKCLFGQCHLCASYLLFSDTLQKEKVRFDPERVEYTEDVFNVNYFPGFDTNQMERINRLTDEDLDREDEPFSTKVGAYIYGDITYEQLFDDSFFLPDNYFNSDEEDTSEE